MYVGYERLSGVRPATGLVLYRRRVMSAQLLYTYLGMCCPVDTRCALCMNLLMSADLDYSTATRNSGVIYAGSRILQL